MLFSSMSIIFLRGRLCCRIVLKDSLIAGGASAAARVEHELPLRQRILPLWPEQSHTSRAALLT